MDSKSKFKGMKMPMPGKSEEMGMEDMFGQSDDEMAAELEGSNAASEMSSKPNPAMSKFSDDEIMAEYKARGLESAEESAESPAEESSEESMPE